MKTKLIISTFCTLEPTVFAQANLGICHAYQNGRPNGLYRFNAGSTFLFAGFFKQGPKRYKREMVDAIYTSC